MQAVKKLKTVFSQTKRFAKDTAGATAVMFSLGTVVVVGSIAFGVDAAYWFQTDRRLQTGADLSALAAASSQALNNAWDYAGEDLTTLVRDELERDGVNVGRLSLLEVNSPPTSGAYAGNSNAVEVIVAEEVQIFFAGMFVEETPAARARAVALSNGNGNFCILTLHPTTPGGVTFSGSTSALLGCGVATNSNASDAVLATGASIVSATVVTAVGGIDDRHGNIMTPVTFQEYANPLVDPFQALEVPASAPCDHNRLRATDGDVLDPGVYCGDLRVSGDVTFNPGTYVLDGGDFVINAGAVAQGDDVTFVFTDYPTSNNVGKTQFNGTATINFTASTTGYYEGILFMQDPDAPNTVGNNSGTWMFNGTALSSYRGAFYVPQSEVEFSGNAEFVDGCVRVVSGAATFIGNFDVSNGCNDPTYDDIEQIVVTLVE